MSYIITTILVLAVNLVSVGAIAGSFYLYSLKK